MGTVRATTLGCKWCCCNYCDLPSSSSSSSYLPCYYPHTSYSPHQSHCLDMSYPQQRKSSHHHDSSVLSNLSYPLNSNHSSVSNPHKSNYPALTYKNCPPQPPKQPQLSAPPPSSLPPDVAAAFLLSLDLRHALHRALHLAPLEQAREWMKKVPEKDDIIYFFSFIWLQ